MKTWLEHPNNYVRVQKIKLLICAVGLLVLVLL